MQNGSGWDLAGVIFSIGTFMGQPPSTALYGNKTSAVDLAFYRDDILDVTAVPEPSGGLAAGFALLLGLDRRRGARAEGRTPRGHGLWPRLERQSRPQRRRRRASGDEGARRGASAFPPLAQV